jgi:hypothetical protein
VATTKASSCTVPDAGEPVLAGGVGERLQGRALDGEAGASRYSPVRTLSTRPSIRPKPAAGEAAAGRAERGAAEAREMMKALLRGSRTPVSGVAARSRARASAGGEGALDGGGGDTVDDLGGVDDLGAGLGGELLERLPGGAGGNVEHGAFGGAERGGDAERENEQQGQRGVTEGEHTKYTEVDPRAARNPEENFQGSAGRGRISGRSGARACRPGTRRPRCGRSRARFGRAARGCWRGGRR